LAVKETEQVCWLRGFLLIVLLLATFLMAIAIFYSTRAGELDQFETQYADHATKIFDAFQEHLKDDVVASDNMAATLTTPGKLELELSLSENDTQVLVHKHALVPIPGLTFKFRIFTFGRQGRSTWRRPPLSDTHLLSMRA
jgi:hypothetical protein